MKPLSRSGALLCWLVLFCLGAVWIGRQEYTDQHERFLQNTSVAQRMLSQKTVQHEAVLATLAALSHPPAPERLYPSLQPAMPQLLGLGHLHDGVWRGSMAAPDGLSEAIGRARQMQRPVTLPVDDARYWLAAPSGWSLLLDARQLVPAADFPPGLANLTLTVGAAPLRLLDKQPEGGAPGWRLALQKPLGAASQPFTMRSERRLTPDTWPWTAWLAWAVASALLVAGAVAWQRSRAEARRRQEPLRLGAMARQGALGDALVGAVGVRRRGADDDDPAGRADVAQQGGEEVVQGLEAGRGDDSGGVEQQAAELVGPAPAEVVAHQVVVLGQRGAHGFGDAALAADQQRARQRGVAGAVSAQRLGLRDAQLLGQKRSGPGQDHLCVQVVGELGSHGGTSRCQKSQLSVSAVVDELT